MRVSVLDEQRNVLWQRTLESAPQPTTELVPGGPTPVALANARANDGSDPAPAIDGDASAKSTWSAGGSAGQRVYAVFALKEPQTLSARTALHVKLVQARDDGSTLGRFRVSVFAGSPPPEALPERIHSLLATPSEQRTADDAAYLAQYYWANSAKTAPLRAELGTLDAEIARLQKETPTTPIMRELPETKRRQTHIMIKGNFRQPGDLVAAGVPAAFHPLPPGARADRLGLARWLMDADNPLTARVAVNRFWAQLFGVGLVATEEDFGTQGVAPTHPELLDWLAVEFREGGWNMKDILRQIVCSATYRQSSTVAVDALEKDPGNRFLARGPRYRLEAEMVRDQALAISGLLSRKQGGPSVFPPQPPNLWRAAFNGQRTWATSTGGDRYRRGLYTFWRRTVPYPSMAAFDAPSREICTMRRISTNTPLQAFVTLNDPVYVEAAQALARRIVAEGGITIEERAAHGLRLALLRPAEKAQTEALSALYHDALESYRADADAAGKMATDPLGPLPPGYDAAELAAWTVAANVILNLDGVLTKR